MSFTEAHHTAVDGKIDHEIIAPARGNGLEKVEDVEGGRGHNLDVNNASTFAGESEEGHDIKYKTLT